MRYAVEIILEIQLNGKSPSTFYCVLNLENRVKNVSIGSIRERISRLIFQISKRQTTIEDTRNGGVGKLKLHDKPSTTPRLRHIKSQGGFRVISCLLKF